jgi:hypothetical protein
LLYCFLHYLVKDPSLVSTIFRYFFRHWPVQVAKKQVLILNCINEIIATVDMTSISAAAPMLFGHIAKILHKETPHFQVADKCFSLLENDKLMECARRNSAHVVRVLCPALQSVARHHWNTQLQSGAFKLHKRYANFNVAVARAINDSDGTTSETQPNVDSRWARIFALEKTRPVRLHSKAMVR